MLLRKRYRGDPRQPALSKNTGWKLARNRLRSSWTMLKPRSYAILGTGALGGFYGARLCRSGADVHFLVHSDFEHVHRHGLVIDSKDGDFVLPTVQADRKSTRLNSSHRCI